MLESDGNIVEGNRIGVTADGTFALGNGGAGVFVPGGGNTIGGTSGGARNVISGNVVRGVFLSGSDNLVLGNFIGTTADGTAAIGSDGSGIWIEGANNVIGGPAAGAGNLISGNGPQYKSGGALAGGVVISGTFATGNLIQGNLIGTDIGGTAALGNRLGVDIYGTSGNTIGGTVTGAGNVISGNTGHGIVIEGPGASANLVQGNLIGTDATGMSRLGNAIDGIVLLGSSNTIGGTVAGAANTIAFNSGAGVAVSGGLRDLISANPIHDNGGPGIDLGDAKLGSNLLQHFPEIASAVNVGGATIIRSTLDSVASRSFTLEWFASAIADHAGFGQGASFLGTTTVVTDASGHASFLKVLPFAVPLGHVLSATAIDQDGNTSGFSLAATVKGPALVQWSVSGLAVDENAGTATLLVARTGNPDVPVTVHVATAGGDAQPGINYTPVDTVLTFAAWGLDADALDHRPRRWSGHPGPPGYRHTRQAEPGFHPRDAGINHAGDPQHRPASPGQNGRVATGRRSEEEHHPGDREPQRRRQPLPGTTARDLPARHRRQARLVRRQKRTDSQASVGSL